MPYLVGLPGEDMALGTAASCLGKSLTPEMDHGVLGTAAVLGVPVWWKLGVCE